MRTSAVTDMLQPDYVGQLSTKAKFLQISKTLEILRLLCYFHISVIRKTGQSSKKPSKATIVVSKVQYLSVGRGGQDS